MTDRYCYYDEKLQAWVTVCPPGAALGAKDITNWSHRRARGMSGSDGWKERKQADKWAKGKAVSGRNRWRPSKRMRAKIRRGEA